jgi:DNA mismatch repair protein MutL
LMTLSCHRSVRRNDVFAPDEGLRLILELLSSEHPYSCPHGRPTILSLGRSAVDSWFGR